MKRLLAIVVGIIAVLIIVAMFLKQTDAVLVLIGALGSMLPQLVAKAIEKEQ